MPSDLRRVSRPWSWRRPSGSAPASPPLGPPPETPPLVRLLARAGFLAALVLGSLVALRVVAFATARAAQLLPPAWEAKLGELAFDRLAPPSERCRDPALDRAVDEIAERLTHAEEGMPRDVRVVVSDDPEVNAFALPGARIVVMRGLLEKTRRPEELAGILAHELQHVRRHDAASAFLRWLSLRALASFLGGSWLANGAEALAGLHYDRGQEAEADREGMALVLAAGLDGRGMVDAYRMLARTAPELPGPLLLLSDHPDLDGRIRELAALAGAGQPSAPPLRFDEGWEILARRCGRRR